MGAKVFAVLLVLAFLVGLAYVIPMPSEPTPLVTQPYTPIPEVCDYSVVPAGLDPCYVVP